MYKLNMNFFLKISAALCAAMTVGCGGKKVVCEDPLIIPRTLQFAQRDTLPLMMDIYVDSTLQESTPRPVLIYMFGGAWMNGRRNSSVNASSELFSRFAHEGYAMVSIDYRLGYKMALKEGIVKDSTSIFDALDSLSLFNEKSVWAAVVRAARYGVEDLYAATKYLIDNAECLNIDPSRIMVSGGSAGAINALMGEYLLCNDDPLAKVLPEGFDYAAVFPFAGGIWDDHREEITWGREPCPIMMFCGEDDRTVPMETNVYEFGASHGANQIIPTLQKMGAAYDLYIYEGYGHEVFYLPMALNVDDMFAFIHRTLVDKEKIQVAVKRHFTEPKYDILTLVEEGEKLRGVQRYL